jgi:hypothetical protein
LWSNFVSASSLFSLFDQAVEIKLGWQPFATQQQQQLLGMCGNRTPRHAWIGMHLPLIAFCWVLLAPFCQSARLVLLG